MDEQFRERLGYEGEISDVLATVCEDYNIGTYKDYGVIKKGYEDVNIRLETGPDTFLVKIFNKTRSDEDCRQYVNIMETTVNNGIQHPGLLQQDGKTLYTADTDSSDIRLCVMEFVHGQTLDNTDTSVSQADIQFLAEQSATIHNLPVEPHDIEDSWAIPNFLEQYEKAEPYLDEPYRSFIEQLVEPFKTTDIADLPHCFVHGDIRETNLMRDQIGELWILDFSVSSIYPRIQEFAVMASSILLGDTRKESEHNLSTLLEAYQQHQPLTNRELGTLPLFVKVGHAMNILGPTYVKHTAGTTEETEYWLQKGKHGLSQYM